MSDYFANACTSAKGCEHGIELGSAEGDRLTDLRFADDVVLVAQNQTDLTKMLNDLSSRFHKYGLRINFAKTKILTWNALAGIHKTVSVEGQQVEILDEATPEKILGQTAGLPA